MEKNNFVRKKLLVDRKLQTPFILGVFIALLIIIIIISVLIIKSTSNIISGSVYNKIVNLKNTNEIIIPVVLKIGIIILIFGGGIIIYYLLKYTHKIAGPLIRFKKCLKDMGKGNLTIYIKFRKKDKLKELDGILSTTAKNLNKRITSIKKQTDIIKPLILEKNIKKLNHKEVKKLKNSIETIEFVLNNFKTE